MSFQWFLHRGSKSPCTDPSIWPGPDPLIFNDGVSGASRHFSHIRSVLLHLATRSRPVQGKEGANHLSAFLASVPLLSSVSTSTATRFCFLLLRLPFHCDWMTIGARARQLVESRLSILDIPVQDFAAARPASSCRLSFDFPRSLTSRVQPPDTPRSSSAHFADLLSQSIHFPLFNEEPVRHQPQTELRSK